MDGSAIATAMKYEYNTTYAFSLTITQPRPTLDYRGLGARLGDAEMKGLRSTYCDGHSLGHIRRNCKRKVQIATQSLKS